MVAPPMLAPPARSLEIQRILDAQCFQLARTTGLLQSTYVTDHSEMISGEGASAVAERNYSWEFFEPEQGRQWFSITLRERGPTCRDFSVFQTFWTLGLHAETQLAPLAPFWHPEGFRDRYTQEQTKEILLRWLSELIAVKFPYYRLGPFHYRHDSSYGRPAHHYYLTDTSPPTGLVSHYLEIQFA